MRNSNTYDTPLQNGDLETQTVGCRHTNPDICAKNSVPGKCAFTSKTNICLTPPATWSKKYRKLKSEDKVFQQNIDQQQLLKPQDNSITKKQ